MMCLGSALKGLVCVCVWGLFVAWSCFALASGAFTETEVCLRFRRPLWVCVSLLFFSVGHQQNEQKTSVTETIIFNRIVRWILSLNMTVGPLFGQNRKGSLKGQALVFHLCIWKVQAVGLGWETKPVHKASQQKRCTVVALSSTTNSLSCGKSHDTQLLFLLTSVFIWPREA